MVSKVFGNIGKFLEKNGTNNSNDLTNDNLGENNYSMALIFKFIDFVIEIGEIEKLCDWIQEIESLYDLG